jgi:endonuclease YncB( thermonuclease family)
MRLCFWLGIVFFVLSFFFSCSSDNNNGASARVDFSGQSREGYVVKIVDGDTYDVIRNGVQTRVRMDGIDAPERGMDYYKVSKDYLGSLCMNKKIRLQISKKDRYGRLIAKTYLPDGREAGQEMVRAGMAWHFKKYSSDATLARLEREARSARRGLWSVSNPTPPWEYRKRK